MRPRRSRLRQAVEAVALDEFRRMANERAPEFDALAWLVTAPLLLLHTLSQWQRGLPAVAILFQMGYVLHTLLLVWLLSRHRAKYVKFREAFMLAALVHASSTTLFVGSHQGTNIWQGRMEAPFGVLGLLAEANTSLWITVYTLYARPLFCIALPVLPLLSLNALLSGPSLCQALLQVPGMQQAFSRLLSNLTLTHYMLAPLGRLAPLQQCLVLDCWCICLLGIGLPLVLLYSLETRARQEYYARQTGRLLRPPRAALIRWPPAGCLQPTRLCTAAALYVSSCVAWLLAGALVVYIPAASRLLAGSTGHACL